MLGSEGLLRSDRQCSPKKLGEAALHPFAQRFTPDRSALTKCGRGPKTEGDWNLYVRSGGSKPVGSCHGGEADINVFNARNTTESGTSFADRRFNAGCGMTGAGGAISGEQQTQWSSGRSAHCKLAMEGPFRLRAAMAPRPEEFMGAVGSHRSYAQ